MARSGALILIIFIFVSQLASFSTARKIPGGIPLVIDGVIFSGEISDVASKTEKAVGCESEDDHFTKYSSSSSLGVYVTGTYGSLVLNALPKGSVPASGPSKKINDVKT